MKSIATLILLPALAFAGSPPTAYYATPTGGAYNSGAAYMVVGGHRTVLYDFCPVWVGVCPDGAAPLSDLLVMPDGSLIGATSEGGATFGGPGGVLFKLEPQSDGSWSERVLYEFCPYFDDCSHFGVPSGGLTLLSPNMIEGMMQKDGGTVGLKWRLKLTDRLGVETWTAVQHWEK